MNGPAGGAAARLPAWVVREVNGSTVGRVEFVAVRTLADAVLDTGTVVIDVEYSSLNYKDALASQGQRGVVRTLPHVPGIDCAGAVSSDAAGGFSAGEKVLVTGYGLGSDQWGGYSGRVCVPAEWVVRLPAGMTTRQAMLYGTAGFTAAQCVDAVLRHGATASAGPLLVTGATGGVGVLAVAILAKLGFEVVAMSGKPAWRDALLALGAAEVVGREALAGDDRPLLKARYAGGVDTVGGAPLSALLRSTSHRGCVACCGLVAGADLPMTVHPFILRGVTLAGIDSAKCPREPRLRIWRQLAGPWRVDLPDAWVTTVDLDGLPSRIEQMLAGKALGRTLVRPTSAAMPDD
ncbi:MAG: YhdH/YhfP family quinone oxidoreductase [Planctomycetota bacterium]